jgi:hypothetical protein
MSEQNEIQNKTEEPKTTKRITTGKGRGRPRNDAKAPERTPRTPRPRAAKIAKPSKRAPRPKTKILRGDQLSQEARAFFSGIAAAWKREKGVSLRDIGDKVSVGASRIDALIHGKTDVRISWVAAVAREAFGVDLKTYIVLGMAYQDKHKAEDALKVAAGQAKAYEDIHGVSAPAVSAPFVEATTPA